MQKRARAAVDAEEAEKEADDQTWASLQTEAQPSAPKVSERDQVLKKLQGYECSLRSSKALLIWFIREYDSLLSLINKGLRNVTDDDFVPTPPHWHAQNRAPFGHSAPQSELDHLLQWLSPATVGDIYLPCNQQRDGCAA